MNKAGIIIFTIILIGIGIFVGLFLLKLAITWFVPINKTAKALLTQELKKYDLNSYNIPDELLTEIVEFSIKITEVRHLSSPNSASFKADLVRNIQFQAEHLNNYIQHPEWDIFENKNNDNPFLKIYEKYNLSSP